MKRIISVALAVVMVLALSVSAFAAYEEPVEFGLYFGDPITADGALQLPQR